MAFLGLYIFYWFLIYALARNASGFKLTAGNARLSLVATLTVAIALTAHLTLPTAWAAIVGAILALIVGRHCFGLLWKLVGPEKVGRYLQKLQRRFPSLRTPTDGTWNRNNHAG